MSPSLRQQLLQLVARLLAPFELPVEPADLLLEAGDDAAVTLVEEVEDLELAVHVLLPGLLELREEGGPEHGRDRVGTALGALELGEGLLLGVAERNEPVGRGRVLAPQRLDERLLTRGAVVFVRRRRRDKRRSE